MVHRVQCFVAAVNVRSHIMLALDDKEKDALHPSQAWSHDASYLSFVHVRLPALDWEAYFEKVTTELKKFVT